MGGVKGIGTTLWILAAASLAGATTLVAQLVLSPPAHPETPEPLLPPEAIQDLPIDGPQRGDFPAIAGRWPEPPPQRNENIPAPIQPPPITLLGTMTGLPGSGMAIVRNRQNEEGYYRTGEVVNPGSVELLAIERGRVQVRFQNRDVWVEQESATLSSTAGAGPNRPTRGERPEIPEVAPTAGQNADFSYDLTMEKFNYYIENVNRLYLQGGYRIVPGKGLQIRSLDAGAEIRRYGIREGDIVKSVNGQPIDQIQTISRIFGDLENNPDRFHNTDVLIEREGRDLLLRFRVQG